MSSAEYYVGIDLGTTNCVVSYIDSRLVNNEDAAVTSSLLAIPQCMADGSVRSFNHLPSSLYILANDEQDKLQMHLPWAQKTPRFVIGHGALQLGQKRSAQLVQSVKSWLSYRQVDRRAAILPWGVDTERKMSPFDATVAIIEHLKLSWDAQFPAAPLSQQKVALTLPASFDEEARGLTLEAANHAGLPHLYLLEEPQAACYSWISDPQNAIQLVDKKMLLVVDIGGGTSDFSLVAIKSLTASTPAGNKTPSNHSPGSKLHLTRIAVGNHLLLGGDNLDQALAFQLDPKQISALSATRLAALVQQTRQAKETLLGDNAPESLHITLLGGGSKLIGGAQKFTVEKAPLLQQIDEGFFPLVEFDCTLNQPNYGMQAVNLPYEKDPAIHRHLATFLATHKADIESICGSAVPDAVLFNGGLFNSPRLKQRMLEQLAHWRGDSVFECQNIEPNAAVAQGAAVYVYGLDHPSLRIESGAAHSLYLEMADGHHVAILPKGSARGVEHALPHTFSLRLGETVQFPLLRADDSLTSALGQVIEDGSPLHFISYLTATLDNINELIQEQVNDVVLYAQLTEIGTLQVRLTSAEAGKQWLLYFNTEQMSQGSTASEIQLHPKTGEAAEHLVRCFSAAGQKSSPQLVKTIKQDLDKILGDRALWNLATSRNLVDKLLSLKAGRMKSPQHERQWLLLLGYCLRPGYGADADASRVSQLWALLGKQPQHDDASVWGQYWTVLRRIAGGLSAEQQALLFQSFSQFYSPTGQRSRDKQKQLLSRSSDDLIRLIGALEWLADVNKKHAIDWLLKRLGKSSEPDTAWWTIGRLASRQLLYADDNYLLAPADVVAIVEKSLQEDWKKRKQAALAAVMITQETPQESPEILNLRAKVRKKLIKDKCPSQWLTRLDQAFSDDKEALSEFVGEALPIGIQLTS